MQEPSRKYAGKILRELFERGLSGELEERIVNWLADSDSDPVVERELAEIFEECMEPDHKPGKLSYRMLEKAHRKLDIGRYAMPVRLRLRRLAVRAVAVLLPMALIAGVAYLSLDTIPHTSSPCVIAELYAAEGEPRRVVLPDSSQVVLNAGSTLTCTGPRRAEFSGEGYFDIISDPSRPFVITSGELTVTVLGTRFNFSAVPGSGSMEVELYHGAVEVAVRSGRWTIDPGQKLSYDTVEGTSVVMPTAGEKPAWMAASLAFGQVTLGEVLQSVGWYYGRRITIGDGVDIAQPVAIWLSGDEPLETVLYLLDQISEGFVYTISDDAVTIEIKR